jgi:GTP-binding protein
MESGCPFVVVANKLDKLKKSEIEPNLQRIRTELALPSECMVIPFSAEKGTGKDELVRCVTSVVKE